MSKPSTSDEEVFEGERALTEDCANILKASIGTYVLREAERVEVPKSVIWDTLEVSPAVDRLMCHLPRLLAQHFIVLHNLREEQNREDRRKQFEKRTRREEERDENHTEEVIDANNLE